MAVFVVTAKLLSPKFQDHEVGVFVLVSVNVIGLVVFHTMVDAVIVATGSVCLAEAIN